MEDSNTTNGGVPPLNTSPASADQENKPTVRKSKVIALLACAAGLVALALLLVLYVTVWSKPNKADFAQARNQATALDGSYQVVADASSAYVTEVKKSLTNTQAVADSYNKAVSAHHAKMDALGRLKALRDKDVKATYDALATNDKKFLAYNDAYIIYQKSFIACMGIFQVAKNGTTFEAIAAAHKKEVQKCSPILKDLENSSVTVLSDYGKRFYTVITERQKVLDELVKGSITPAEGTDKINELTTTFTKGADITKDLTKARDDAGVGKELKAFHDILDKKAAA